MFKKGGPYPLKGVHSIRRFGPGGPYLLGDLDRGVQIYWGVQIRCDTGLPELHVLTQPWVLIFVKWLIFYAWNVHFSFFHFFFHFFLAVFLHVKSDRIDCRGGSRKLYGRLFDDEWFSLLCGNLERQQKSQNTSVLFWNCVETWLRFAYVIGSSKNETL